MRSHSEKPVVVTLGTFVVLLATIAGCGSDSGDSQTATSLTEDAAPPAAPAPLAVPEPVVTEAPKHEDGSTIIRLVDCEEFFAKGPGDEPTWTSEADNRIHCSGSPKGYLYTKHEYGNFAMRCDFRYARPEDVADESELELSNTGFLIYISGKHKQWPVCLEVQGRQDTLATIKANGGAASPEINDDDEARKTARSAVGEWNSIEITSRDGALTAVLNGTQICTSQPTELVRGHIGIQSENFEVEFRDWRILTE